MSHASSEKQKKNNPQHNMRNKGTDIPFIPENELHILSIVPQMQSFNLH